MVGIFGFLNLSFFFFSTASKVIDAQREIDWFIVKFWVIQSSRFIRFIARHYDVSTCTIFFSINSTKLKDFVHESAEKQKYKVKLALVALGQTRSKLQTTATPLVWKLMALVIALWSLLSKIQLTLLLARRSSLVLMEAMRAVQIYLYATLQNNHCEALLFIPGMGTQSSIRFAGAVMPAQTTAPGFRYSLSIEISSCSIWVCRALLSAYLRSSAVAILSLKTNKRIFTDTKENSMN